MSATLTWQDIKAFIKERRTSWIYKLSKDSLVTVCERLKIPVNASVESIEQIRDRVSRFVKDAESEDGDTSGSIDGGSPRVETPTRKEVPKKKMANFVSQVELFQKTQSWSSFSAQLEAYIILNEVAEEKKTALLLTRLSPQCLMSYVWLVKLKTY